ncbi:MAG TPA: hypothetical protein VFH80_27085 [Solirubrobacteraceae bacterium]|nr:hypothetical protein [Solirubrobacteraceae bacterium]
MTHGLAITPILKRLAAIVGPVILLSACGGGTAALDSAATANYVDDFVFQKTGFRPVDVRCPSGIHPTAGGQFTCHFTGPEGPYTAYLRIVKAQGHRAAFDVDTQPSSWPAPKLR